MPIANVNYVYEAPKNGQTVVNAAQRHGALSYSIKAIIAISLSQGSAVKFVLWGL